MTFKDHFSGHAATYAKARPDYPPALFQWLARQCASCRLAWDCATGNGQAARALAGLFERVVASDGSTSQIAEARGPDNVIFEVFKAETPELAPDSVDLVTVAQALHWFDTAQFFSALDQVLKPGGVLACWCYGLTVIDGEGDEGIDPLIRHFYTETIGDYWPSERRLVERQYSDIDFPYTPVTAPHFQMEKQWTSTQLLAYLGSWSATQRYVKSEGKDPIPRLARSLEKHWADGVEKTATWPLTLVVRQK